MIDPALAGLSIKQRLELNELQRGSRDFDQELTFSPKLGESSSGLAEFQRSREGRSGGPDIHQELFVTKTAANKARTSQGPQRSVERELKECTFSPTLGESSAGLAEV